MSKHRLILDIDGSACFDVVRASGGDLSDLAFCLSGPLLTGEQPGFIDAVRLQVYGITVVSVEPSPSKEPSK